RLDHPPLPCRASPPQGGRLAASAPYPFSPPGTGERRRGRSQRRKRGRLVPPQRLHPTRPLRGHASLEGKEGSSPLPAHLGDPAPPAGLVAAEDIQVDAVVDGVGKARA